jgi:hypothetical protein
MSALDDLAHDGITDSRAIEERIAELASAEADPDENRPDTLDDDERDELAELRAFRDEAEPYCPDWNYGETIIRESAFEDYAQELAEDCGMIPAGNAWPLTCIDWTEAADQLKQDYTTTTDANGTDWYYR